MSWTADSLLTRKANELVCTNATCALAYPVRDDIPVLLIDEARETRIDKARESQ